MMEWMKKKQILPVGSPRTVHEIRPNSYKQVEGKVMRKKKKVFQVMKEIPG
jgi:hypothetical protein